LEELSASSLYCSSPSSSFADAASTKLSGPSICCTKTTVATTTSHNTTVLSRSSCPSLLPRPPQAVCPRLDRPQRPGRASTAAALTTPASQLTKPDPCAPLPPTNPGRRRRRRRRTRASHPRHRASSPSTSCSTRTQARAKTRHRRRLRLLSSLPHIPISARRLLRQPKRAVRLRECSTS
jgi:hypothetical protein